MRHSTSTVNLATFDIWDTCLTRRVALPRHVFSEVAMRLTGQNCYEHAQSAEIAAQRCRAEAEARSAAPDLECDFPEIMAVMAKLIGRSRAEAFASLEMEIETEFARPIESTRTLVERARASGGKVAFISDMYLPVDFLRKLLVQHGFAVPSDPIFVSGDRRAGKRTKALFRIVQNELGVPTRSWSHVGDKADADLNVPRQLGIMARQCSDSAWTPSESRAVTVGAGAARAGSLLAGGMRAVRVGLPYTPEISGFLSNVAAPWLCALAARMVHSAESQGLNRLYFLSRDGEILLRVAKSIAAPSIDCRYLYSSRRAWCFAAMLADDQASRRWLETFSVSPRGILGSLEFTPTETDAILNELKLTDIESRRRAVSSHRAFVWDHLRSTGRMKLMLERAMAAREQCLAYLEQEGLLEDSNWAVCDVGWVLNGQAALNRLLKTRNPRALARGSYFMVNRKRPPVAETGPFNAWVLDELLPSGTGTITQTLTWLSGLIEEVFFTNADASLRGYRFDENQNHAMPLFDSEEVKPESVRHAMELRQAVDRLVEEWRNELRDPVFVDLLSHYSLRELLRFLRRPSKDEASVVAKLRHSSEATNAGKNAGALARPWHLGDVIGILARRARLISPESVVEPLWTAGCDALSSRSTLALRSIALAPVRRNG